MIARRQPPVAPPVSLAALMRAAGECAVPRAATIELASQLVKDRLAASAVTLTDTGTSALILALRLAAPPGGIVALPAYSCVDLVAAAQFAGVRVRLYDLDPQTLSPDLESVAAVLKLGVSAIVVAHLFGYAADVTAVRALAVREGVVVIEDAAQGAGARLAQRPLGSLGDLGVLSFGRGKGLCAGGGGALVARREPWEARVDALRVGGGRRGWTRLAATGVQWMFGRPALYAYPSAIPWLHLGETVYHAAHEPASLSRASGVLLAAAIQLEVPDIDRRSATARTLRGVASESPQLSAITPIIGAQPSYLRYAVRDLGKGRSPAPGLGIVRPYPVPLNKQREMESLLLSRDHTLPGAAELSRSLFTLPTHQYVNAADVRRLAAWLREPASAESKPPTHSSERAMS